MTIHFITWLIYILYRRFSIERSRKCILRTARTLYLLQNKSEFLETINSAIILTAQIFHFGYGFRLDLSYERNSCPVLETTLAV